MALVFGQSLLSAAAPLAEPNVSYSDGEDSDDEEYVYVSRLAEQIAAHAMLDEEEDDACPAESPTMERNGEIAFCSYANEVKAQKAGQLQNGDCHSVSHFAAAWRDYGPTEWDCFYTPTLQPQATKQGPSFHVSQLDQIRKFRSWSSLCYINQKQERPNPYEAWDLPAQSKTQPFPCSSSIQKRKESVGTGVFLPKLVNTGSSHYRRKAGLSSRASYAPRSNF